MLNLVDIAKNFITPDMGGRLAAAAGLPPETGAAAISSALPLLLAGFANTGSTPAGAGALVQQLTSGQVGETLLSGLLSGNLNLDTLAQQGEPLVQTLFGSAAAPVTDSVARFHGVAPGGIARILTMLAPLVLSLIGRQLASSGQSGPAAVTRLFAAEKAGILNAIPAGLRSILGAIPGLGFLNPAAAAPVVEDRRDDRGGIGGILPWLLLLAGLAALVWWLTRDKTVQTTTTTAVTKTVADFEEAPITATIPEGVAMLTADSAMTTEACNTAFREALAGATIEFDTDKALVRDDAKPVLDTLAGVAGRCSGYRITVEGHTDLTGSQATNLPLSRDRALAVANYLVTKGVNPAQLRAIGYGESRPKVATGGAAQINRRIELTVTQ